jgi:predicted nucleic acid-binding Zn ribbon protein
MKCETKLSVVKPITESAEPPVCADCGNRMIRKFNFGAVTFNGSGFYATDKNKKEE